MQMLQTIKKKRLKVVYVLVVFFCVYATHWFRKKGVNSRSTFEDCDTEAVLLSTNDKGRTKNNGDWFWQTEPFHLYVYSAFFDDRLSHGADRHLAIIAIIDKQWLKHHALWCRFQYGKHGSVQDNPTLMGARAVPSGVGTTLSPEVHLVEHVIVCFIDKTTCPPTSVALAWGHRPEEQTKFRVPVEISRREKRRRELAVCVSTSYGKIDRRKLVEWLEMQRILGVELVVMYNHSISGPAAQVLHDYAHISSEQGATGMRVEVRQSHEFLVTFSSSQTHHFLHKSPNINDCMYRYSGSVRHFAVIDLDEIIVPRTSHRRLPDLVASMSGSNGERFGTLVFRNAYFFEDFQSSPGSKELFSTFLTHRRRLPVSPRQYSVKSIVDSDACIAMHNHYCWDFTSHFSSKYRPVFEVPTDVALLHHYKRCHFDSFLDSPDTCKSQIRLVEYDDIMKKYDRSLSEQLTARYTELNITVELVNNTKP